MNMTSPFCAHFPRMLAQDSKVKQGIVVPGAKFTSRPEECGRVVLTGVGCERFGDRFILTTSVKNCRCFYVFK
jgi:hypothetical protein